MKYLLAVLSLVIGAHYPSNAQNAADVLLIAKARSILSAGSYCDSAMNCMQSVSEAGKESNQYYSLMGSVYECKGNKEYAAIYYDKALKIGGLNDSLPEKIRRLIDTGEHLSAAQKSIREEQRKIQMRDSTFKKSEDLNIEGFYALAAMGYSTMVGGKKAMSKHGINFSFSFGVPAIRDKFLVDFLFGLGGEFGKNPSWHDNPAYSAYPALAAEGTGLLMGIEPSLNYILINSRYHTLTFGGIFGGQVIFADGLMQNASKAVTLGPNTYFSVGPRLAYYGWSHLYVAAEYLHYGMRKLKATVDEKAPLMPVNLDLFRVDLGFRFILD